MNISDNEDNIKIGEIKYKKNKYFFVPNIQEELEDLNGGKAFSWLVFKGEKYPMTKNKYKIKEGDIFKLARIFFIVRGIHIKKKNLEQKVTNYLLSYHTQIKESLNVNEDYYNYNNNDDNSSESSNADICEEDDNDDEEDNEEEKNDKSKSPKKIKRKNSRRKRSKSKKRKKRNKNAINELKTNTINVKPKNIKKEERLITNESKKSEKQKICRICYVGEIENNCNPLIKPCKCSGSMKYIHYKCLLHWLKTKIQIDKSEYIDNNFFLIYSPENVQCELCKEFLPHFIKHNNVLYNLTELEQNYDSDIKGDKGDKGDNQDKKTQPNDLEEENYVVFDSMSPDKEILPYRYIVKFGKNNILKIGRGLDMNLILNDLSISRNHCQLELTDKGDIFLKDNNSKFGTLILVQAKSLEILKGQTLTIQAGRTYFNLSYKSNFSLFNCCNPVEIDLKSTYEKMNSKSIKLEKNNVVLTESDSEREDLNGEADDDGKNKINDEDKKESNEYEKKIKKINNKKIKILKISQKDKKGPENTDINIDNKDKENEDNKDSIFMTDHKKERNKSKKKSNKISKNKEEEKDIEIDN